MVVFVEVGEAVRLVESYKARVPDARVVFAVERSLRGNRQSNGAVRSHLEVGAVHDDVVQRLIDAREPVVLLRFQLEDRLVPHEIPDRVAGVPLDFHVAIAAREPRLLDEQLDRVEAVRLPVRRCCVDGQNETQGVAQDSSRIRPHFVIPGADWLRCYEYP